MADKSATFVKATEAKPDSSEKEVLIRPRKLTGDRFVQFPVLGRVGKANGLSLLRYRVAPALVPEDPLSAAAVSDRNIKARLRKSAES